MSKQTFKTRKEAKAEEAKMQGWETKVTQLYQPNNPNANANGNVFVIQCDGDKYLQETDTLTNQPAHPNRWAISF